MSCVKVLIAVFLGTFCYTIVSFLAGQNGLWSYNQLSEQKKQIAFQTNEIEKINNELNLEYTALLKDRDVVAAYARKIDYVTEDERLVKITGLPPYQTTIYDTGTVVSRKPCVCFTEEFCKICGISIFIFSLLLIFMIDYSKGNISFKKRNHIVVEGIPVYDMPQI